MTLTTPKGALFQAV